MPPWNGRVIPASQQCDGKMQKPDAVVLAQLSASCSFAKCAESSMKTLLQEHGLVCVRRVELATSTRKETSHLASGGA